MKRATVRSVCAVLCLFIIPVSAADNGSWSAQTCVLWPLYAYGGGVYLYYADYYPTACTDQPQVTYWYGSISDWPETCPSCQSRDGSVATADGQAAGPFPGMHQPLRPGDDIQLPDGQASSFARAIVDDDIEFVKMADTAGNAHTAKVFLLAVDTDGAKSGVPTGPDRFVYVAEEVTGTIPATSKTVTATSSRACGSQRPYFVYDCTCAIGTNVIHVMVLLAPPQPTPEPTAAK